MVIKAQWNRIFQPVHETKCRYVAMKGSAGSGKSVDTAQFYIVRLMKDKGRNLLCVRKTDTANKQSTFAELCSAISRMNLWDYWTSTVNPLGLKCINGNEVIFRGVFDDRQREKVKSITINNGFLTDIWIEEATELTAEDFEILDDRLRGILPDGLFYQVKMTFNPVSATHWIKRRFFDVADKNVFTHHSTYLNNRFIDEAYYERMQRRKLVDPEGYVIYGLGEWGELGGLILSNYKIEEIRYLRNEYDDYSIGQDFGFSHANALLGVGYKDGDLYVDRQIYVTQKDTSEIIEQAKKEGWPRTVRMYCDSAEPDRIKMWRDAGFSALPVRKTKNANMNTYVKSQIDWLRQRTIYISPDCTDVIKEIQTWKYKPDGNGGYTETPVPFFDDAMAALRYAIEPWRRGGFMEAMTFVPEYEVRNSKTGW